MYLFNLKRAFIYLLNVACFYHTDVFVLFFRVVCFSVDKSEKSHYPPLILSLGCVLLKVQT